MECAPGGTPSVIAYGDATFPKGTAFGGGRKVSGIAQRRPLGGAGCERSEQTEGVLPAATEGVFNRKNDKKYNISTHLCK